MPKTITLTDLQYDTLLVMLESACEEIVDDHSVAHSLGAEKEELDELEQIGTEYAELKAAVEAQGGPDGPRKAQ